MLSHAKLCVILHFKALPVGIKQSIPKDDWEDEMILKMMDGGRIESISGVDYKCHKSPNLTDQICMEFMSIRPDVMMWKCAAIFACRQAIGRIFDKFDNGAGLVLYASNLTHGTSLL